MQYQPYVMEVVHLLLVWCNVPKNVEQFNKAMTTMPPDKAAAVWSVMVGDVFLAAAVEAQSIVCCAGQAPAEPSSTADRVRLCELAGEVVSDASADECEALLSLWRRIAGPQADGVVCS